MINKILKVIALIIVVCMTWVFYWGSFEGEKLEGAFMGMIGGLAFAMIPFFIGQSIDISGKKEAGSLFSEIKREYLLISNKGIQFGYHDTEYENNDNMSIYEIQSENLNAIIYDQEYHIITIIGEAKQTSYDDMQRKIINEEGSQRKFYSNSPYEIMLAFNEEEEIVKLLKGMAKNARDE
ncbi:hypothetical protein [Clostridium sp.]|uniref:hypothetical protein n=1 Tax=Clostridium sp. TaxID=1506 RepID=UPI0025BBA6B5|nr:hypothetical protein [Clostridium sp.]